MSSKSRLCLWCGARTTASGGYCQTCKSKRHHAGERIKREGLIVDQAGGSWWIWDAKGGVLVMGQPTKGAAINALAFGDEVDDDDGNEKIRHMTMAKTPAQLEAEIAEVLALPRSRKRVMKPTKQLRSTTKLIHGVTRVSSPLIGATGTVVDSMKHNIQVAWDGSTQPPSWHDKSGKLVIL